MPLETAMLLAIPAAAQFTHLLYICSIQTEILVVFCWKMKCSERRL